MTGGYDPAAVPSKRCLMCKLRIGDQPWREVTTLARFGQMLFEHEDCPLKVLFLDIDGVCNSAAYAKARGKGGMLGIDPEPAALIRRIVQETGCKVVLSSYWRLYPPDLKRVREEVCELLDCTKSLPDKMRGAEVREWMQRHPDVERYAILDDDSDFYDFQPLFRTSFNTGLLPEMAERVIKYLNEESENVAYQA